MRRLLLLAFATVFAQELGAQEATPTARPLGTLAAQRVAIAPVQYWRADSAGWSATEDGQALRAAVDSAIAVAFRDRGMGTRWAYAGDVVRAARRNPTFSSDPTALGVGRWRNAPPKPGDALPTLVADNLRILSALGDTRLALIPVEVRGEGTTAVLRLVLADTRLRSVVWAADISVEHSREVATALGARVADLVVDP